MGVKSRSIGPFLSDFKNPNQNWCKAGGITNFAKVGILTEHPNYGWPCVTGAVYWQDGSITTISTCIFCGRVNNSLDP